MALSPVARAQRSTIKTLLAALENLPGSPTLQHALADVALEANSMDALRKLTEVDALDRAVARKLATSAKRVSIRSAMFRTVDWTAQEMLELLRVETHASVRHEAFRVPGLPAEVYRDLADGSKPQPSRLLPAAGHLPLDVLVRAYEAQPAESSHEHPADLLRSNPDLALAVALSPDTALPWRVLAAWLAPEPDPDSDASALFDAAVRSTCAAVDAAAAEHDQNKPWTAFGDLRVLRELLSGYGTGPLRVGSLDDLTGTQRRIVITFARYGVCAHDELLVLLLDSPDEAHRVVGEFLARPAEASISVKDKTLLRRAFTLAAGRLSFEEVQAALTRTKLELWSWVTEIPDAVTARIGENGVRDIALEVIASDRCPAWLHTVPDAEELARRLGPKALASAHGTARKAGNDRLVSLVDHALVAALDGENPLAGSAREKLTGLVGRNEVPDHVLADVPLEIVLNSKSDVGARLVENLVSATTAARGSLTVTLQTLRTVADGGATYGSAVPILEAALGLTLDKDPAPAAA